MLLDLIGILGAIAIILIAGMTVFYCVVRHPEEFCCGERLSYSYAAGIAVLGTLFFVNSWAGFRLNAVAIGIAVIAAALIAAKVRGANLREYWLSPRQGVTRAERLTEFEWVVVFIIALCVVARTWACLVAP